MRIHGGIVVAVIVILMMFFFWRTKLGVKIDLIGQGDKIATYAGVNVKKNSHGGHADFRCTLRSGWME